MKLLYIKGFNFSDPSLVFYNNVAEDVLWEKLNLKKHTSLKEEWLNYLTVLLYHKHNGYTHITNDDKDEGERYINFSIDEEINRCKNVIEDELSSDSTYNQFGYFRG